MRKTYQMILALAMIVLGATNAMAGELISLEEVPFWAHEPGLWGLNAAKNVEWPRLAEKPEDGSAYCPFVLGVSTGQPYGDASVNAFADLSMYSKLIVVCTEGTPRFLFNRDMDEGQWSATEAESHLIDNTKSGWSDRYFSFDGVDTYTVDLKLLNKEKGFAHLHSIKGANWANVTITSMMVEKVGKAQQIGWINLINNSNLEGDDASSIFAETNYAVGLGRIGVADDNVSSFYSKENGGNPYASIIEDGVGVSGGRAIRVHSAAGAAQDWDAQFWINASEDIPAGAKMRVSFDYRASMSAEVDAQAHGTPSCYIFYNCINANPLNFTTDWQTHTWEGEVETSWATQEDEDQSNFHSIAFNLSKNRTDDIDFFFDNIKLEVFKAGIVAEYNLDMIKVDFGFDTNIADLVKASGKPRLIFPKDIVTVTVDGQPVEIMSVEGFADGRFYIFLEEAIEGGTVHVTLKNPADATYHLIYTNGPGGDVPTFDDDATENGEVGMAEDEFAYNFVTPIVIASEPEAGSFNLPNSIKEFKVTFDKLTDCSALVAKLGKENLTKTPAEGFAEEVTLTRTSDGDLETGEYTITLDKVYPDERLGDDIFGTYTIKLSVGKVEADPNDVAETVLTDNFADSENPGAGWIVTADPAEGGDPATMQPASSGAGSRLQHGQAGFAADVLYLCSRGVTGGGVALYGTEENYKLNLAAKNYHLTLGSAKWDGEGAARTLKVQVLTEDAVDAGNGAVLDESKILVEETKAIEPDFKTTKEATLFDILVPVKVAGNYVIRLVPGNSSGNPGGYGDGNAIGNVKVEYNPNVPGAEWLRSISLALESAKTIREENDDARHHGPEFDALDAAIKQYEAEYPDYTAPSQFKNAVADLTAKTETMKNHGSLINTYDPLPGQAQQIIDTYAGSKFETTELYQTLKTVAAKYVILKEEKAIDPETGEEKDVLVAYPKELTDDAELQAAIDELKDIVAAAQRFFTEGESKTSSDVGIKVLVDRIRQGVVGLMQLGVAETDDLIVRANNAVTDDDELAEELKNRIKLEYYNKMKNGEDMFPETVDEETLETTTPTYNFTVFVKNPNTYAWKESQGVTAENCPGWTIVEGETAGLTSMWNGNYPGDIDGLPKDLCITQYHHANRIEQTIYDLPAGVYTVMIDATEWSDEFTPKDDDSEETIATKNANHELNRAYLKTSDTPVFEEGEEEQFKASARLDYRGQYVGRYENYFENIDVVDGELTLGVKWNALAQFMFDRVQVFLAAPANGFDYAKAYEDVLAGIDVSTVTPEQVRSIQLFDLNGRRIVRAQKGINIVKKVMSDGTIKTEKVVNK